MSSTLDEEDIKMAGFWMEKLFFLYKNTKYFNKVLIKKTKTAVNPSTSRPSVVV